MRLTYLTRPALDAIYAWARQLVDDLNRVPTLTDLPVFASDAAAADGAVIVGGHYVTPDGAVRRRMA